MPTGQPEEKKPLLQEVGDRKQQPDNSWACPNLLLTQRVEGAPIENILMAPARSIDDQSSRVLARSTHALVRNGEIAPPYKRTGNFSDDKVVIGYTSQGLPFNLVVDGFFDGNKAITFAFIDNHVIPLIDWYAKQLSASDNQQEVIESLIKYIGELWTAHSRDNDGHQGEFTMAIAIVFEKDNQKYCAGFSLGDCGLVLKKATDGRVVQLAHNTEVNKFKDAFDRVTTINGIDSAIIRNEVFTNIPVDQGDEILGYTSLVDMEEAAPEKHADYTHQLPSKKYRNYTVDKHKICGDFKQNETLFDQVVQANDANFTSKCAAAIEKTKQPSAESVKFGDDCTISSVKIPSPQLQRQLQILATAELITDSSEYDETLYAKANTDLKQALSHPLQGVTPDLLDKVRTVRDQVVSMKASSPSCHLPMLIKALLLNTRLLTERESPAKINSNADSCTEFGLKVRSAQHSGKRMALGILMMMVGAAAIVVGALTIVGSIPTGALPATVAGGAILGTGIALFAAGAGITFWKRQAIKLNNRIQETAAENVKNNLGLTYHPE